MIYSESHITLESFFAFYETAEQFGKGATLMQYTGLKDKNGREIFEGDILELDRGLTDYYYVVEWVFAGFQLVTYKKPESTVKGISDGLNQGYFEESDNTTVIGNIHETAEKEQS